MVELCVTCHENNEVWWAETEGAPSLHVTAPSLRLLRREVVDALQHVVDSALVLVRFLDVSGKELSAVTVYQPSGLSQ